MLRKCVCTLFALMLMAGLSLAADVKGKVKSVNVDKGVLTVTVGDKDTEFKTDKDTKIVDAAGKAIDGGLKASVFKKAGANVTVTTDKDVVKQVQVTDK